MIPQQGRIAWTKISKDRGSACLVSAFIKGISHVLMKYVNVKQLGHAKQNDTLEKKQTSE